MLLLFPLRFFVLFLIPHQPEGKKPFSLAKCALLKCFRMFSSFLFFLFSTESFYHLRTTHVSFCEKRTAFCRPKMRSDSVVSKQGGTVGIGIPTIDRLGWFVGKIAAGNLCKQRSFCVDGYARSWSCSLRRSLWKKN